MDTASELRRRSALTGIGVVLTVLLVLARPGAKAAVEASSWSVRVPVLMYHRISQPPPNPALPGLWVTPSRFRAQLQALKRDGWRTITAERLGMAVMEGRPIGPKRFVITIDDGARDGYNNAAPILERLGMQATYCVVPGHAHRPWQLSFRQMRALRAAGHEIANHSLTHVDLRRLSQSGLRRQVFEARRLIGKHVGHTPRTFCYPMGLHDANVRRVVEEAGHLIAFTTVEGARHRRSTAMTAPRVRVDGWDSPRVVLSEVRP